MKPSWKTALWLIAAALLALVVWGWWLVESGRRHRAERDRAEAPVLRLLGGAPASVHGLLRPAYLIIRPFPIVDRRVLDALDKIGFASKPLADRVAVCRATRFGTPAEVVLDPAVPLADPADLFGPPASKYRFTYSFQRQTGEYWKYGDLHLGLLDGKLVWVRVY